MHRRHSSSALGAHWRADMLRTNLWLVPGIEVLAAIVLFAGTLGLDRAAYRGEFGLPSWVISGTADAARQILTAIAAAGWQSGGCPCQRQCPWARSRPVRRTGCCSSTPWRTGG